MNIVVIGMVSALICGGLFVFVDPLGPMLGIVAGGFFGLKTAMAGLSKIGLRRSAEARFARTYRGIAGKQPPMVVDREPALAGYGGVSRLMMTLGVGVGAGLAVLVEVATGGALVQRVLVGVCTGAGVVGVHLLMYAGVVAVARRAGSGV